MKLEIDIDEAIYKEIKEEVKAKANTFSHIPFLHEVISVGKPLNKRLTGKWEWANNGCFCSECHVENDYQTYYCPNCGARMEAHNDT